MSDWPAPVATLVAPAPVAGATARAASRSGSAGSSGPLRWWTSTIVRALALVWCWTILWLTLWGVAPMAVGWSPSVVVSGSMEPTVRIGSIVQVDHGVDLDRIGPGAIITFDDPGIEGLRVTHRVTGVEQVDGVTVGFRTRGDANAVADSTIVPAENVEGAARVVVPLAGYPNVWLGNGQWIHLLLFLAATGVAATIAVDTLTAVTGTRSKRGGRGRTGVAVALAALLGMPSSSAAFGATSESVANQFDMTTQWHLDAIDRANPVAHWRLGEPAGASSAPVLFDDFETFVGWNNTGSGSLSSSTAAARSGSRSGRRSLSFDPSGAWKSMPATVSNADLEVWVNRPSTWWQSFIESTTEVGLENASFNGYSVRADHSSNLLVIDRRTAGNPSGLASVPFDPPEDTWYRLTLERDGTSLVASAWSGTGTLLATTSAVDGTTTSFDRVAVRGSLVTHVDDLLVTQPATSGPAVDRLGTLDGAWVGAPTLGMPGLVAGDPDTAATLAGGVDGVTIGDHNSINLSARAQRSLQFWFSPSSLSGRQVLYEEGGTSIGMNVYLDGSMLYATAWSNGVWSNRLVTNTPVVVGGRYHVTVTLDAVTTRSLVLSLDGVAVSTSTKSDTNLWPGHSDDGAIGRINGATTFHDGSSATSGAAFSGTIDEVVLYNSVLSPATIANQHDAGR